MRERLKSDPNPALIRHLFGPALKSDAADNFDNLLRVNLAHTVLLARAGIIAPETARPLLELYREMARTGPSCLELDPTLEDLHFNVEAYVIRRLGPEVGGTMHTGRSRNDLNATTSRMKARDALLQLVEVALSLRRVLLNRAETYAGLVMPGYTHLQPAQPITLGHYLSAMADALERDTARLEAAYGRTNRCPLGAGALAGTGFPLDRALGAQLLGFDGLVENSLDAVASRDYALELLSALAILTSTVSRVAGDLYVWATDEFGLIELADEVALVSSIMPQKKNPVTLEHCKAKAAQVLGALVAALGAIRAAPFSNVRDVNREALYPLKEAVAQSTAAMELMAVTVDTLTPRPERMGSRAQGDFSTVTELADSLVRTQGLPFRSAHRIVALLVAEAAAAGRRATEVDAEAVQRAAEKALGHRLDLGGDWDVQAILDPRRNVLGKQTLGSPQPDEVRRMVDRARKTLATEETWLAERRQRLASAAARLDLAVSEYLHSASIPPTATI